MSLNNFDGYTPTWCPGCGDWAIRIGLTKAFTELGFDPSSLFLSFDIGCSGNMNDFVNAYAMHGLHGRAVATAVGMKLANHKMETVVIGGDGGTYGEGGNHFLHACRGNHDMTVIVHDNMVYGLTTGQVAPTAEKGYKSKSTPTGILERPVNPLALALTQGATFIAQAFAGNAPHLIEMVKAAVQHKGFSLVNVLQPCVTFNKVNTYQYYLQHAYKLPEDYDKTNFQAALAKSTELLEEKFPLGIIYQVEKPTYHEELTHIDQEKGLLHQERFTDIQSLVEEFV
jgi:2-oxoglutarate/2-oxoacid ferredoxin oxidoreductase subunit beta